MLKSIEKDHDDFVSGMVEGYDEKVSVKTRKTKDEIISTVSDAKNRKTDLVTTDKKHKIILPKDNIVFYEEERGNW